MTCRNCGEPITRCQNFPCWYHPGSGWHRCDGKPVGMGILLPAAPVAEPVDEKGGA